MPPVNGALLSSEITERGKGRSVSAPKPIPNFRGYYADREGNIYSRLVKGSKKSRLGELRELKHHANIKTGYRQVSLRRNGHSITVTAHRLVLETFIGPRPSGMVACHGKAGRSCDRASNLSWGTMSKNCGEDKVRDGTALLGVRSIQAKLNDLQVRIIRRLRGSMSARVVGYYFGVSHTIILKIWKRITWRHL